MKPLIIYHYFFYELYKSIEYTSVPRFWSQWKAIALIILLEIWLFNSIDICYHYFYEIPMSSSNSFLELDQILYLICIITLNWFLFDYKDKWREIIIRFDEELPKRINLLGGIIVWLIVLSIIIFYWFYTFPLLAKVKYN